MAKMGVALGGLRLCVPEDALHLIQRPPAVNQKAGKGMPQIMHAHLGQARIFARWLRLWWFVFSKRRAGVGAYRAKRGR